MTDMAERVKFWEEQQRINELLIPNVLDMSARIGGIVEQTQAHEARTRALQRDVRTQLSSADEDLDARLQGFHEANATLHAKQRAAIESLSERVTALETLGARPAPALTRVSTPLSVVALVLGALGVWL